MIIVSLAHSLLAMTFEKYYVRWRHNDVEAVTELYEFLVNALDLDEKVETDDDSLLMPTIGDRYRNPYSGRDMIIVDSMKSGTANEDRYCLWFTDPKYKSSSRCPGINMDYADDIEMTYEYVNSKLRPGYAMGSTNSSTAPYRLITNYNMVKLKDGRVVKIVNIENGDDVDASYPEMIAKGKMNVSVMQALKL